MRRVLPDGIGMSNKEQPVPRKNTDTSTNTLIIHKVQAVIRKALPNQSKVVEIITVNTLNDWYKLKN